MARRRGERSSNSEPDGRGVALPKSPCVKPAPKMHQARWSVCDSTVMGYSGPSHLAARESTRKGTRLARRIS